ncbi:hypothetical protein Tcan_08870 [Toxocara canis]|uniref:Uncharacterized protein n=1 Tax=Toxocara canis TaxID=6265 RepID=A0A0B2W303_TOXCA|nr:hypothetical protein Tcan_08870 [Toxocara canis]
MIMECTRGSRLEICSRNREEQICRLGWVLLALWLIMIVYMTKDFWMLHLPCVSRNRHIESDEPVKTVSPSNDSSFPVTQILRINATDQEVSTEACVDMKSTIV